MYLRSTAFPRPEELGPRTIATAGDALLIDGNTRISVAIKYPTQPT